MALQFVTTNCALRGARRVWQLILTVLRCSNRRGQAPWGSNRGRGKCLSFGVLVGAACRRTEGRGPVVDGAARRSAGSGAVPGSAIARDSGPCCAAIAVQRSGVALTCTRRDRPGTPGSGQAVVALNCG